MLVAEMRAVGGGCRLYREEAGASRKQLVAAARLRQHEQPHDEPGNGEDGAEGSSADGNVDGAVGSDAAGAGSADDSRSTGPRAGKGKGDGKGKGKTTGGQLANARFERWGSLLLAGVEPEEDAASTEAGVQVAKELRTVRVQAHHFQNLFLFATRMGRRGAACE